MTTKKSTLINMFAALITLGVQMFISFWLSPYVVGKLGEEAYGFLNLANNFVSYANLLAVAINSMACRYISIEYNQGRREAAKKYFCSVFWANCILYVAIMIISFFIIANITMFVNVSANLVVQVKWTLFFAFMSMGVSLIGTVYTAATFTTSQMQYNSLVQIISNVFRSILIYLLFIFMPPRIYYICIATLLTRIETLLGNNILTKRLLPEFNIRFDYFQLDKLIRLFKSGIWVLISNVSNLLLNGLDLLLSNWFISSAIMGRLSLAKQIPFALSNALGVFSNIFSSTLTKVYAGHGQDKLVVEANEQLRILAMFFSVPYAGVIVFGRDFIKLWLNNASYTTAQQFQIYILMLLTLVDIVTSTYMYSIHSVFLALDKVKKYSVILLISSFISVALTILLLKKTTLGVYAIAGTSTMVLGITHGLFVPACAARLMKMPIYTFWKTELKSWMALGILCAVFVIIKLPFTINCWESFALSALCTAIVGYLISAFLILNKEERSGIIMIIQKGLRILICKK